MGGRQRAGKMEGTEGPSRTGSVTHVTSLGGSVATVSPSRWASGQGWVPAHRRGCSGEDPPARYQPKGEGAWQAAQPGNGAELRVSGKGKELWSGMQPGLFCNISIGAGSWKTSSFPPTRHKSPIGMASDVAWLVTPGPGAGLDPSNAGVAAVRGWREGGI